MGIVVSSPRAMLSEEEILELKERSGFSGRQIVRLYSRFCHLDKGDNYKLSREDLERVPELAINPLGSRVLDLFFPTPADGEAETLINFPEFLDLLSIFRKSQPRDGAQLKERKLKFVFDLYDVDKDGSISRKELLHVIEILVGECGDSELLEEIVVRTLVEATGSEDGSITFENFKSVMKAHSVDQNLVAAFH